MQAGVWGGLPESAAICEICGSMPVLLTTDCADNADRNAVFAFLAFSAAKLRSPICNVGSQIPGA
jgi:hypothetical protein